MNSLAQILHTLSYMGLPLMLAMVLHEYAHGWVANRLGDPTARLEGRLSLNPLVHIDPYGTILMPLLCLLFPSPIFFGWAKPVPINPARLYKPRRDMALVAAAGPAMNFALAIASGFLLSALFYIDPTLAAYWPPQAGLPPREDLLGMVLLPLAAMAFFSIFINILLMAFNLIPIPPLDGGRILTSVLPYRPALAVSQLEPYGMFIIVGLIIFDPQIQVIRTILGTSFQIISQFLLVPVIG